MKRIFSCVIWILGLVGMAGCIAGAGQPARRQTAAPSSAPGVALHDCQISAPGMQGSVRARCGSLAVFEDQGRKSGRTIELNIAVVPAVSRQPEADPVFLLAGGPGQAAVETFAPMVGVLDRLNQKRDLVMVDQRGTGESHPLRCPTPEASAGKAPAPTAEAGQAESSDQEIKDCLAQLDGDPRLYTTTAAVEDLEQVRAALAYEQINLFGVSYGTRLAQAYQRAYPQHTRTATLDSVNPLDWELGPHNAVNAQHALDRVFARCAADAGCAKAFPQVQEEFKQLLADLDQQPVDVALADPTTGEPTQVHLTRDAAAATFQLLLYTPETAAMIPLLVHAAATTHDYRLLAAQTLINGGSLSKSIDDGLYLSVLCAEDAPFFPTETGAAAGDTFLRDRLAEFSHQCSLWPHATVDPAFKQPLQSDVPTLLLSGEADPITPPANADQAARGLTHALTVVAPGVGHNVLYRGCVPKIVTRFIESGSEAGLDTACVAEIQPAPFWLTFSGSQP